MFCAHRPFKGSARVVVVRECRRCAGRDSELVGLGFPPPPALRSQDDPAGDLAFTQLIQRLVGMSKRARNHMAAYLPDGSLAEYRLLMRGSGLLALPSESVGNRCSRQASPRLEECRSDGGTQKPCRKLPLRRT